MDRDEELAGLEALSEGGGLWEALERYLVACRETAGRTGHFPNAAGLARALGVSVSTLERFGEREPEMYGRICAVLEDEALNSGASATVLSAYLKQRLGYGEREKADRGCRVEEGQLRLVFEHDIMADGE